MTDWLRHEYGDHRKKNSRKPLADYVPFAALAWDEDHLHILSVEDPDPSDTIEEAAETSTPSAVHGS